MAEDNELESIRSAVYDLFKRGFNSGYFVEHPEYAEHRGLYERMKAAGLKSCEIVNLIVEEELKVHPWMLDNLRHR